jgi:hypothetical protein
MCLLPNGLATFARRLTKVALVEDEGEINLDDQQVNLYAKC